jgi:mRNA-decapping enzyme 1B
VATLLQKVVQSLAVDPDAAAAALLSPLTIRNGNTSTQQQQQQPPTPPVHRPSPSTPQHSALGGAESPVLDKKSLQLALLSLLHDERFLDLIHAQYLKVAHARANKKSNTNTNNSDS